MNFTKINLDTEYLEQEKIFFTDLMTSATKRESTYKELDDFFAPKSINQMLEYKETYFKWYAYSTWQQIQSLKKEKVLQSMMYYVPLGCALGIDIWDKLMWYFATRTPDVFEMEDFFEQSKNAFFNSSFPMGIYKGIPITVSQIIKEIIQLNAEGNDSLKTADLKMKIQKLLFENGLPGRDYVYVEADLATLQFFNLVHFFIGVKKDRIAYIVNSFVNPNFEEFVSNSTVNLSDELKDEQSIPPEQTEIQVETTPDKNIKSEEPSLTLSEIKSNIDTKFEKDETGQYTDLEGVFAELEEIAIRQNDESIKELLYFDETSGGFKWKE